jgi:hypothetical protein
VALVAAAVVDVLEHGPDAVVLAAAAEPVPPE